MGVLTAAQAKAAKAGVAKILDQAASVVRLAKVGTPTGRGNTQTTIYAALPCVIVANPDTMPTTDGVGEVPAMRAEAVGYFAPTWPVYGGDGTKVAVILRGSDLVTVGGLVWTVTEDMDPQTATATECVVKLHRNDRA